MYNSILEDLLLKLQIRIVIKIIFLMQRRNLKPALIREYVSLVSKTFLHNENYIDNMLEL